MEGRTPIARAIADTIVTVSAADPTFVDRIMADPVGTLEPLGVSAALAREAAAELRVDREGDDVTGYATKKPPSKGKGDKCSCKISLCTCTIVITIGLD